LKDGCEGKADAEEELARSKIGRERCTVATGLETLRCDSNFVFVNNVDLVYAFVFSLYL